MTRVLMTGTHKPWRKNRPPSNDVDVDGGRLIYMVDRNTGFDILEYRG